MTHTLATETAELPGFPIRRACPAALPAEYERTRGSGISRMRLPTGKTGWIITSYEYARAVLSDPRFSSDKLNPHFPRMSPNGLEKLKYFAPFLVNQDGMDHARAKRLILNEFSPKRVDELRTRIQHIVDRAIDEIQARPQHPVDLVETLSYPTALAVQELLLGIPAKELATVRQNTENLVFHTGTSHEEQAAAAVLHHHLDGVLAEKEERLGDDLVSRQIMRHRAEYGSVDRYLLTSLVQLLAVGGFHSSATMTSLGVLALLTHPAELAAIRKEPELMAGAVDELLRFYSVNDASPLRLATADVRIGGTLIRAGEGVAVPPLPANRDPELCDDPHRLDLLRRTRTRHIAFGHGPHRCLAPTLVSTQLEIVYATLFRRLPELTLAVDADELSYSYRSQTFGPDQLPVNWAGGAR
jgi:cytochrome P450